jgi:hypothetical protein
MRGFRAVILGSCLWVACISDLKPEVGPLAASDQDVGDRGTGEGGESNGSSGNSETEAGAADSGDAAPSASHGEGNDAGAPVGCRVKDSDTTREISFAKQVRPILAGCGCHDPNDVDPFAILDSGLTIADYKTLREGGHTTGAKIIVDGNACDSIILQKLGEMPPFGDRMPLDGPYLSLADRTLISDWIVEGARDN